MSVLCRTAGSKGRRRASWISRTTRCSRTERRTRSEWSAWTGRFQRSDGFAGSRRYAWNTRIERRQRYVAWCLIVSLMWYVTVACTESHSCRPWGREEAWKFNPSTSCLHGHSWDSRNWEDSRIIIRRVTANYITLHYFSKTERAIISRPKRTQSHWDRVPGPIVGGISTPIYHITRNSPLWNPQLASVYSC